MTKIFTLKKRKDFLRVASGFHIATYNMVLQATQSVSDSKDIFVGYTATKKVGKAVVRNKCKRRLRALVSEILNNYALPNVDYVFIARNSTAVCKFADLKRDAVYALKKINKNFLSSDTDNITDTGAIHENVS